MNKAKIWTFSFIICILMVCAGFMVYNYHIDSNNYFKAGRGEDFLLLTSTGVLKCNALEHMDEDFDAFVVGGSKAGTYDIDMLNEATGKNWYDFTISNGTFKDYEAYIPYLVEEQNASEIILYLSGHEVTRLEPNDKQSAYLSGNPIDVLKEKLKYLTIDIDNNREYLEMEESYEGYTHIYGVDGTYDYRYFNSHCKDEITQDYIETYVINKFPEILERLYNHDLDIISCEDNLMRLQNIVDYCDAHEVKLTVVMGPKFLGENLIYEDQEYYDYLRGIVEIVPMYDFSTICDYNLNPYNFINQNHCGYSMNSRVTEMVLAGCADGDFGILLTPDNIEGYLARRQAAFDDLMEEYEETGTVGLLDDQNPSYIIP